MNNIAALLILIIAASSLGQNRVHEIHMLNMAFLPKNMTVRKGDKIKFINDSPNLHNVVFEDKQSPYLKRGESYEIQFDSKGMYPFYCLPHRAMGMSGEIKVDE